MVGVTNGGGQLMEEASRWRKPVDGEGQMMEEACTWRKPLQGVATAQPNLNQANI